MKARNLLIGLAATALLASAAAAGARETVASSEPSAAKRMVRGGIDGSRTSYTVACRNGEPASVYVKHDTDETCAVPRNGTPVCKKEMSLRDAGHLACKASAR